MDKLNILQDISFKIDRKRLFESDIKFNNPFTAELIRGGRIISVHGGFNGVTIVGKNHLLDVAFGNSTPVTQVNPWYIGLINQSPTPTLSENDTLASHSGWAEFTSYSGSRKAWDDANASNKVKGTTTLAEFAITADASINGILIASVASGTSGILWSTGSFTSGAVSVLNGDTFRVAYAIRT